MSSPTVIEQNKVASNQAEEAQLMQNPTATTEAVAEATQQIQQDSQEIEQQTTEIQATELTDAAHFIKPALPDVVAQAGVTAVSEVADHEQATQALSIPEPEVSLETPENTFPVSSDIVETPDGRRVLDNTKSAPVNSITQIRNKQLDIGRKYPNRIQVKSLMQPLFNFPPIKWALTIFR